MKVAHLILTYTDAGQTERMVRKLQHEDFDFYVQLDKKVPIETHNNLKKFTNLHFIKNRMDVRWSGYSQVESIFAAITEILQSSTAYDFINLMSGQDYPIKSTGYIHDFLNRHKGRNFLGARHMATEWPEALQRIKRYHMIDYTFKGRYAIERVLNKVLPERKCPIGLEYYGESMFWTITPEAAAFVRDFVTANKKYVQFLRYTWAPSEFIFQTVLMNSSFRPQVVKEDLLEVEFPAGSARPKIYTSDDFETLRQSGNLFARKFNMATDSLILDKIDAMTAMHSPAAPAFNQSLEKTV